MSTTLTSNGQGLDAEFHDAPPPETLDLEIDVHYQAQHVTVLHLKEPTGKQMRLAERELANGGNPASLRQYQMRLVASVANVPMEVIEAMPVSKINEAFSFLSPFIARGLATGVSL